MADHNVNINVNVRREDGATPTGAIRVTRAKTSRYKDYAPVEVAGPMRLSQIRERLFHEFDLDEGLTAVVSGAPRGDDFEVQPGMSVHFQPTPKDRG